MLEQFGGMFWINMMILWTKQEPPVEAIEQYVQRLREFKQAGAQIPLVQVYSTPHLKCGQLPLRTLSAIARRVREDAGLKAEVF